jgi:maltose alpha-D-glucosyltransferase/alpha-amylase
VDEGVNPDVEIGAFLTDHQFEHTPPLAGYLEYLGPRNRHMTMAMLEQYLPHEGDAWDEAQQAVGRFLRKASRRTTEPPSADLSAATLLELASGEPDARELLGNYLDRVRLLGSRTAELHLALSDGRDDAAFRPQPFTSYHQRSLYQAMRRLTGQTMFVLRTELDSMDEALAEGAQSIAGLEEDLIDRFGAILKTRIEAVRTRYHGDYRLSQVLRQGDEYFFVDFEGEPDRLMAERQLKHSPLRDVANMIRSLYGAAHAPLSGRRRTGSNGAKVARLEQWADYWAQQASAAFLGEYLRTAGDAPFIPKRQQQLRVLLDTLLLERALMDLQLALTARPEGAQLALRALQQLLAGNSRQDAGRSTQPSAPQTHRE